MGWKGVWYREVAAVMVRWFCVEVKQAKKDVVGEKRCGVKYSKPHFDRTLHLLSNTQDRMKDRTLSNSYSMCSDHNNEVYCYHLPLSSLENTTRVDIAINNG